MVAKTDVERVVENAVRNGYTDEKDIYTIGDTALCSKHTITMTKLATLGPKGTYSDFATLKYLEVINRNYEIIYYGSIKKTLQSVGNECDLAVLPIENFSEGFVSLVLDFLINSNLTIVSEIMLPIQFSFVTNAKNTSEIKRVFVQFIAKGQCSEYLSTLGEVEIISTESNIESLSMVSNDLDNSSAIVPSESFDFKKFGAVIENVNDYKNNQTRFIVVSTSKNKFDATMSNNWKTSFVILDVDDRPGILAEILGIFAKREINLTSIISRPTKVHFGKYHFFIDIVGHSENEDVAKAIMEISNFVTIKNMGSYPIAKKI